MPWCCGFFYLGIEMTTDFTFGLKTYRSFFQQEAARIPFSKDSIVALVGPNNAGKSIDPARFISDFLRLRDIMNKSCRINSLHFYPSMVKTNELARF